MKNGCPHLRTKKKSDRMAMYFFPRLHEVVLQRVLLNEIHRGKCCKNNYQRQINTYSSKAMRKNSINHKGRFNCIHLPVIADESAG